MFPVQVLYVAPSLSTPDVAVLKIRSQPSSSSSSSSSSPCPIVPLFSSGQHMMTWLATIADDNLTALRKGIGEDVLAIGYCLQDPNSPNGKRKDLGPAVTRGVIAKLVTGPLTSDYWSRRGVVMVQSTAAVYCGMSGGLLWRCGYGGLPVGLLVSHVR